MTDMKSSSNSSKRKLQIFSFSGAKAGANLISEEKQKAKNDEIRQCRILTQCVLNSFAYCSPELLFVVPKSDSSCGQDRMFGFQLKERIALRSRGWQTL